MVRLKTAVRTNVPEVAVAVTFDVPTAALPATVNVSSNKPEFNELNAAVTPTGSPELASVTVPVNPFSAVTTTDAEPLVPGQRSNYPGFAVVLHSGGRAIGRE